MTFDTTDPRLLARAELEAAVDARRLFAEFEADGSPDFERSGLTVARILSALRRIRGLAS